MNRKIKDIVFYFIYIHKVNIWVSFFSDKPYNYDAEQNQEVLKEK